MTTAYAALFEVAFRHAFYMDGRSRDFRAVPTPGCQKLLDQHGLLFRRSASGFTVYAQVLPGSDPPALIRDVGSDAMAFRFYLRLTNPDFSNITRLPEHDGMRSLFYFNNLREDRQDGRRYLGDSVAGLRLGEPVRRAFGAAYTYSFAAPVNDAALQLTDLFDNVKLNTSVEVYDPAETVSSFQLNPYQLSSVSPGRYALTDSHGGREDIYYDPSLFGHDVFGLLEIYNRTDALTPDDSERVPAAYRFLDGDEITGKGAYTVAFEPRSTVWRYIVTKKYDTNGIALDNLGIAGGIAFTKSPDTEQVTFTSDAQVPLAEAPPGLTLEDNGTKIRRLPHPRMNTPLKKETPAGPYRSDMYVYI